MNVLLQAAYEVAGLQCPAPRTPRRTGRRGRPSLTAATPSMGYAAAARALNCSLPHLWRVLNGERHNPALLRRYEELVGKNQSAA